MTLSRLMNFINPIFLVLVLNTVNQPGCQKSHAGTTREC
jgi:hypothetical protein